MPVTHTFHPDQNYLEVTLTGTLTLEDLTDEMAAFINDGAWRSTVNALWDCRALDSAVIDQTFLEGLVTYRSNIDLLRRRSRAAILIDPATADWGDELTRQFERSHLSSEIRVFLDRDAALQWVCEPSGHGAAEA
ncbi:STAS/SEC14 domain-containing protein [Rhodospira trueperi]|uniref:SpoIIAA-like n=1 Tax=Rhodospira trueperi TaxID=69960 RepID=A0A1G6Z7U3_9PROT|nr:STAS/SEC14 domain-containing protein [Rhodospira trueperi]SDD98057.1 SpoIIAA-like [Rhodospira trueperi]